MQDAVTVRVDFGEVERMIRAGDKLYAQAAASSLNKAAAKVRTQAVREIAATARVSPQKLIRNRMKIRRANRNKLIAAVAMLITPVPGIRLEGVHENRAPGGGVSAKSQNWPGAWIGKSRLNSKKMAFRRETEKRFPLDVMKVEVQAISDEVLERRMPEGAAWVAETLPKEIAWRLKNAR